MIKDSFSHSIWHVKSVSELSFKNGVFLLQSKGCHSSTEEEAEWKQKLQRGHAGADGEWGQAGMPQKGRTLFFCHFPLPGTLSNVHTICFNSQCSALFFSPIASSLPWGELLAPLHSIFQTQLISAFFGALTHPKYWLRKVKVARMGLCTLWGFPFYSHLPVSNHFSTPRQQLWAYLQVRIANLPYFQLHK